MPIIIFNTVFTNKDKKSFVIKEINDYVRYLCFSNSQNSFFKIITLIEKLNK